MFVKVHKPVNTPCVFDNNDRCSALLEYLLKDSLEDKPFGGAGIDAAGPPLPQDTLKVAKGADAILLAAIGSPEYDNAPVRPEQGLLAIRKELNLFANIRPVRIFDALKHLSPLKQDRFEGVDLVVVLELTDGINYEQHN